MSLNFVSRDLAAIGSRPAMVLLHAFPMDHRMWLQVVERLDGMPILMVDAPGFGGSDPTTDTPSMDAYADEIAASVGQFGIERIVVAGSSMGGYAALALLDRHPNLVAGIAMIGSRSDVDTPEDRARRIENLVGMLAGDDTRVQKITQQVQSMFSDSTRRMRPEVVEQAVQWGLDASREAITWAQRAISNRTNRLDVLRNSGVPGLIMRGEVDNFSSFDDAQAMALAVNTSVIEVRSCSHLIPIEDPGAVSRYLMGLYPKCI